MSAKIWVVFFVGLLVASIMCYIDSGEVDSSKPSGKNGRIRW